MLSFNHIYTFISWTYSKNKQVVNFLNDVMAIFHVKM